MSHVEHHRFFSNILQRDVMVEVTGNWGYPIVMFPTSRGQFTQNHDFGLNKSIASFVDAGKVKLYNLQTFDEENFYAKELHPHERIANYEHYIQFLIQEFVPFVQKMHATHRIAVAGASFGGFHAANFAFRFPDIISHLIALSGTFSCRSLVDYYDDMMVYFNCPEEFVANDEGWKYKHMQIVLSTSDEDICLDKNLKMSKILNDKGIPHWYDEQKWIKHDWPLWRMVFPHFIGNYFN